VVVAVGDAERIVPDLEKMDLGPLSFADPDGQPLKRGT